MKQILTILAAILVMGNCTHKSAPSVAGTKTIQLFNGMSI